jgi:hypothetical protein
MENKGNYVIDVNWLDKDEAIKFVMDCKNHGMCVLGDIESYNSDDGVRITSIYLENCDKNTWLEMEKLMKEEGIRVL